MAHLDRGLDVCGQPQALSPESRFAARFNIVLFMYDLIFIRMLTQNKYKYILKTKTNTDSKQMQILTQNKYKYRLKTNTNAGKNKYRS